MNIRNLSNDQLHLNTICLVSEERRLTLDIIHHLQEIHKRRLYAILGYSSLWEYCIKELKYSEASAQRRISAMKLVTEIPEVETKIQEGKLSLSTVSQIQSFCKTMPDKKKECLRAVEGLSKREVEKILFSIAPQQILPEKRRVLTETQTEVRFVMTKDLKRKLEKIKALMSHKKYNPSYAELFEMMADFVIDKVDPERKQLNNQASPPMAEVQQATQEPQSRYIPVNTKRALYQRAHSRCEYMNPTNKHRCEETKCLQIEHVHPFALGGSNILDNLQLLCAAHNRLRAIQTYGIEKMKHFLST